MKHHTEEHFRAIRSQITTKAATKQDITKMKEPVHMHTSSSTVQDGYLVMAVEWKEE